MLENCRSNSSAERSALLTECEAAVRTSEMERIKVKKEWMDKWKKEVE